MGLIFFRSKNNNVRYVEYDFIRTIAMLMVLLLHTVFAFIAPVAQEYTKLWWFEQIAALALYPANILFFMLSGKFTLRSKFETVTDYKNFYLNRLYKIIIPMFLYSIFYYVNNFYFGRLLGSELPYRQSLTTNQNLYRFFIMFTSGTLSNHFWFIYVLMGIYLISPFMAKLFKNISLSELICLNIIIFSFQFFCVFCDIFSIPIALYSLNMTSYISYFVLGYSFDKIFRSYKSRFIIIILGIISFGIAVLKTIYLRQYNIHLTDFAPTIVLTSCGIYIILYNIMHWNKSIIIQKIFTFLSKHSFSFYCLHYLIMYEVMKYFPLQQDYNLAIRSILVVFIITSIITLAVAFLCDKIIINPIVCLLSKTIKRPRNK